MNSLSAITPASFTQPAKSVTSAQPQVVSQEQPDPTDRTQLSAAPPKATPAPVQAQEIREKPPAPPPEPVPTTLTMEDSSPEALEDFHTIMDAVGDTPMKDHPHMADIKRRYPQLPEEVRAHGTMALLDALTTPDLQRAGAKLDTFHETMTWARKHKAEARDLIEQGGQWQTLEAAAMQAREAQFRPETSLDRALASPTLLKAYQIGDNHHVEGARLIDQFEAGNPNPGLGTKSLGKGICYLRGREGTRIFYRMKDDIPQWLVVCNKGSESAAINLLRREFDLK